MPWNAQHRKTSPLWIQWEWPNDALQNESHPMSKLKKCHEEGLKIFSPKHEVTK